MKDNYQRNMYQYIDCGNGASMAIVNPKSFEKGGIEWEMRYGDAKKYRLTAAAILDSYDYLISDNITTKEAIRRLRLLRNARNELL